MSVRKVFVVFLGFGLAMLRAQLQALPDDPVSGVAARGMNQREATKLTDNIYEAFGFGNTFMVTTSEGNVIIDTSGGASAALHVRLLKEKSSAPVKYIILTHGHGDHTGGVSLWKEPQTHVIAQKNEVEFLNYQARIGGFMGLRNGAQFNGGGRPGPNANATRRPQAGNYGARTLADILFDDKYEFTLGGVKFEVYSTPGETPDHLSVWIPAWKAAFTGDNYYDSFPNIYTLRGTEPRWALDYVNSLDKVLSWKPDLVLPSHGRPIQGSAEVTRRLTQYRDAILYVHDETVKGMNAGKDVYTLMREIHPPPNLAMNENYGKVSWTVRGIYEGYVGWFDMNAATMYDAPPSSPYAELVKLAGGPEAVLKLATGRMNAGQFGEALRFTDAALAFDPANRPTLELRLKILTTLKEKSRNSNELGWLDFEITQIQRKLM